jgi:TatA/E family protein of Tat protein translocase
MGSLGWPEILLIFIVALLIFGPRKLPQLGKSLGRAMGEFRRATNELKSSLEAEVSREEEKLHGDRRRQVEEAYSRPREQPGSERPKAEEPAGAAGPTGEGQDSGGVSAGATGEPAAGGSAGGPASGVGAGEPGEGGAAAVGEDARPLEAGDPSGDQGDLFAPPGAPAAGSDLLPFGEGDAGARQPPPPGEEDQTPQA